MGAESYKDKVFLITGGGSGIGEAVARRANSYGAKIAIAEIDEPKGRAVASDIGAEFIRCDVRDLADSEAAIKHTTSLFGGVDVVFLNAGITSGCGLDDDFDLATYRRAMAINLDGVVFGVHASLPALRARGGGVIVATASMAGIVALPMEPIYAANKHAVVGLVRSLGLQYGPEGIRINALCPSFADTPLIGPIRELLESNGFPILEVEAVVDTFFQILESPGSGECWFVVPGRESTPFGFRNAPGPR